MGAERIRIKLYGDGADLKAMESLYTRGIVSGFTTNPTLMRNAGVSDYEGFARSALRIIPDAPISFEVFSDSLEDSEREARKISGWGRNVYVKIPITNTKGESTAPLVKRLSGEGIKLNITAILRAEQVEEVADALSPSTPSIVSVFAGRIADTGRDPTGTMRAAKRILERNANAELLWASTRELHNIMQAQECGCHIITVTSDILKKLSMVDKDLGELSLDTVKMFYNDAQSAGYKI
jgi:transaldolase